MKNYLALIVFLLITSVAFSLGINQDVVYIKNERILQGMILEQVPNKTIYIETIKRNVFVNQMDGIEKITNEPIKGKRDYTCHDSVMQSEITGFAELGYGFRSNRGINRVKLNLIGVLLSNPNASLGIGTGLRYSIETKDLWIPILADIRINFSENSENNVSPYLSLGVGYSFDLKNSENHGLLFSPNVGLIFKISDKSTMNVGIGLDVQHMNSYGNLKVPETLRNASLNVGISFW